MSSRVQISLTGTSIEQKYTGWFSGGISGDVSASWRFLCEGSNINGGSTEEIMSERVKGKVGNTLPARAGRATRMICTLYAWEDKMELPEEAERKGELVLTLRC